LLGYKVGMTLSVGLELGIGDGAVLTLREGWRLGFADTDGE